MTRTIFFITLIALISLSWGCGDVEDRVEYVSEKMEHLREDMALDGRQTKLYEELRESILTDLKAYLKDREGYANYMRTELAKEVPDMQKITNRLKSRARRRPQVVSRNIDKFMALYVELNPEQKQKMNRYMAKLVRSRL